LPLSPPPWAETIRVGGVSIPIWKNEGEDGPYYKAGEPELRYRDKGGEWHDSKSYGQRDLVNLAKASMLAHSEIVKRNRASEPEAGETEAAA
jgi:hypothetical protein